MLAAKHIHSHPHSSPVDQRNSGALVPPTGYIRGYGSQRRGGFQTQRARTLRRSSASERETCTMRPVMLRSGVSPVSIKRGGDLTLS